MSENLMNPLKITHNNKSYTISTRNDQLPLNALEGFDFSNIPKTRRNTYEGRLNLRGALLSSLNLSNCNLENVDLSFSNLDYANLDNSKIANSIFFESDIQEAQLTNLKSTDGANFTGSITDNTVFTNTNLSNVIFNDWYDKMYPQEGDSTILLTDEQKRQLNESNKTFSTEEEFNTAIAEGERRLNLPYIHSNEDEDEDEYEVENEYHDEREQAEEDVREGLNTEQRGMQQEDIRSNQVRVKERLNRATAQAQALLANNEEESKFGICSICQENLNPNEEVVKAHNNNGNEPSHIFHKPCLEGWCGEESSVKCPLCNTNVNCNEISNGSRNIKLKGGKRRKTNKKTINKKLKKRQTNKKVTRRVRKATNKKITRRVRKATNKKITRRVRRY